VTSIFSDWRRLSFSISRNKPLSANYCISSIEREVTVGRIDYCFEGDN